MSKTEELKELFIEWRKAQSEESEESLKKTKIDSKNITKDHFCEDGIICEEVYDKQTKKVLFIAKEPNIAKYKTETVSYQTKDFLDFYNDGIENWGGRLRYNICKYYAWMIDNERMENLHKLADRFAFMNLNKRGGDENAKDKMIAEYCKEYKDFIIREIEIIDPDVIVWLGFGTFDRLFYRKQAIFDFVTKQENGITKCFLIVGGKEIQVIKEYHPSYYGVSDEVKRKIIQDNM